MSVIVYKAYVKPCVGNSPPVMALGCIQSGIVCFQENHNAILPNIPGQIKESTE